MELRLVPVDLAPKIWPEIEPHIIEACQNSLGVHTPIITLTRIVGGLCSLWVAFEGTKPKLACTTSLANLPDGAKVCMFELVGGNLNAFFDIKSEIEDWARTQGCTSVAMFVPGMWRREMKDYFVRRYLMAKEL